MQKFLVLVFSLFLLSTLSCTTTNQEVSKTAAPAPEAAEATDTVAGDFDLSGTWMATAVIDGCDVNRTEKWTVEIVQKSDSITAKNIDKGLKWKGKISNNIISVSEMYSSTINRESFKLKVSGDANTLTGEAKFSWQDVPCGTINYTLQRN
jgi:hypothetical protein